MELLRCCGFLPQFSQMCRTSKHTLRVTSKIEQHESLTMERVTINIIDKNDRTLEHQSD